MDEEISFRNDSDSMRMVRRSNPAVWTSASDDPHIPNHDLLKVTVTIDQWRETDL